MKLVVILFTSLSLIQVFSLSDASLSLEIFAFVGQKLEIRCMTNETSTFSRIQHTLENGTVETLLSNNHLNAHFQRSEIQVLKHDNIYVIRIDPVRPHSAGVYSCEDDVSASKRTAANITIHLAESNQLLRSSLLISSSSNFKIEWPFVFGVLISSIYVLIN